MVQVVAEIGCNHKGDMEIAKEMIKICSQQCGAHYVKFQKRNNKELLTEDEYQAPHPNPNNSFGDTYGAHREFLEFNVDQHKQLMAWCEEFGVGYSTSVWDVTSAKEICSLNPKFIKVPSACNLDYELMETLINEFDGGIQVSTGMTTKDEIEEIIQFFEKRNAAQRVVLYVCTSGYPVPFEETFILEIKRFVEDYGKRVGEIGFSGHHLGISIDMGAVVLGATWIERHYTLDRTWKGTDHSASLEPGGLQKLCRDVKAMEKALQYREEDFSPVEIATRKKLKRTAKHLDHAKQHRSHLTY